MPLNWGFVGLGKIAHTFLNDMQLLEGHQVVAVGSRSSERSRTFAKMYNIPNHYGSYDAVWQDPQVEIIYVATPHHNHAALSIAAMNAGKHVLCEKPMGINKNQVEDMINAAQKNNRFLMEALWTRFNPAINAVLQKIEKNEIGAVNYLNADFTFKAEQDENSRLINMNLAGGALLDVGIYPIFLAYILFGMPEEIVATARFFESGADVQTGIIFRYPQAMANIMGGFASTSDAVARICGTKGRILLDARWHETQGFTLVTEEGEQHLAVPKIGKGYTYEMEECARCIGEGQIESLVWSHRHSLDLVELMDSIRQQIGLNYPFE